MYCSARASAAHWTAVYKKKSALELHFMEICISVICLNVGWEIRPLLETMGSLLVVAVACGQAWERFPPHVAAAAIGSDSMLHDTSRRVYFSCGGDRRYILMG